MPTFPFKLGADPEFVVTMNGRKLSAPKMFNEYLKDYDGSTVILPEGQIGKDHNEIAELRPSPSKDPAVVAKNLKTLIARVHRDLPWAELTTTSLWCPLGGHIHLERTGTPFTEKTQAHMRAIFTAMSGLSLPLLMGESAVNQKLRASGGYGSILDFRTDHSNTVEFRPLTAEWLTNERLTKATLSYMGVVWEELVYHTERIREFKGFLPRNEDQLKAIQTLAMDDYKVLTSGLLLKIKKLVRSFSRYEDFKEDIEYIFDVQAVSKEKEAVNYEMARGWGVRTETKRKIPTKTSLLKKDEIAKKIQDVSIENLRNYLNVFTLSSTERSQTVGIEAIIDEIGKVAIAHDWKMNNRFFLFGLPKGIPGIIASDSEKNIIKGTELIKSTRDAKIVDTIFGEAVEAFKQNPAFAMKSISLKTGKSISSSSHSIIVGIPYEDRMAPNAKNTLLTIYDIERKKEAKGICAKELTLPAETDEDLSQRILAADRPTEPPVHPAIPATEGTRVNEQNVTNLERELDRMSSIGVSADSATSDEERALLSES